MKRILSGLALALLLWLAGFQAFGGIEMSFRHGTVIGDVLLHMVGIAFLLALREPGTRNT